MREQNPAAAVIEGHWMIVIDNFGPKIIESKDYVRNPIQWIYGSYHNQIPLQSNWNAIQKIWSERK